jgi:hypothetical protein
MIGVPWSVITKALLIKGVFKTERRAAPSASPSFE